MILFTSCEGPSLDRVWQFPTDSKQAIILSRKTTCHLSCFSWMCLNITFKPGVKYVCVSASGIYRVISPNRVVWVTGLEVLGTVLNGLLLQLLTIYIFI